MLFFGFGVSEVDIESAEYLGFVLKGFVIQLPRGIYHIFLVWGKVVHIEDKIALIAVTIDCVECAVI